MKTNYKEGRNNSIGKTAIALAELASLLFGTYYINLTCFTSNISLFAFIMIAVPSIYVLISGFILGYISVWNIKRALCLSAVLALLVWGVGGLCAKIISPVNNPSRQEAIMEELYEELDRQAYEYMLKEGIIKDGDIIMGGPPVGAPKNDGTRGGSGEEGGYSELYVGITEADPASVLSGVILDFAVAFGAQFAGYKVKILRDRKRM